WVALLRGINVGRNKRVAMADLRGLLDSLGYRDIRTHLQSGNAIFTTGRATASKLEQQIAERIKKDLDMDVSVLVRTSAELGAVAAGNPFVERGVPASQLHAVFLSGAPSSAKVASVDHDAVAPDQFAFGERVIYVRLPGGVMASRLPDWERVLGVRATQRNWNTVTRLLDLVG
ncbi:MAG TPA: DUF1697 domain-containing protein, partial [Candidatus Dormibacteraeota bacterium]